MRIEFEIHGQRNRNHAYFTWTPRECLIGELDGVTGVSRLTFRNSDTTTGGQVVFGLSRSGPFEDELEVDVDFDLQLPAIFVAGKFDGNTGTSFASVEEDDAAFEVVQSSSGAVVGNQNAMVRIRKNANELTDGERDRFLEAFGKLNDSGTGDFRSFRLTHTTATDPEAHRQPGFLPWHRAYLLDLERELQQEDSSVALPYWKFDDPAPNLFQTEFIGVSNSSGDVQFDPTNPLFFWASDGVQGVSRTPKFNTATSGAQGVPGFAMRDEADTLNLGHVQGSATAVYGRFRPAMEARPHGAAHVSFDGSIGSVPSAARDPLFFLLHCNVDRLWAKWQWLFDRHDKFDNNSYSSIGAAGDPGSIRVGHNSRDSMWPWNQIATPPRPPSPSRGSFPFSSFTNAPGSTPIVEQMIDYQGKIDPNEMLCFDYDDVPFLS